MKTNNLLKPLAIALSIATNLWAFTNGDGSAAAPFVISTPEHLNVVRNNLTAHYRLANNIALTGEWVPIPEFQGTFDGNGRTVSGVVINNLSADGNLGFFGFIGNSGVVRNLSVDINIIGVNLAGAIAAVNRGTIEEVRASGVVAAPSVGGLVAENRGTIRNSFSLVETRVQVDLPEFPIVTSLPSNPVEGQGVRLLVRGIHIDLIYVAPGTFMFGFCAQNSTAGTSQTISQGFWIGRFPVTQAQYQVVMTGHPSLSATPSNFSGRPNNPVEMVNFNDITSADGFLARVGARLPTAHEWEFAARGGNRRQGNNGGVDFIWAGSNTANDVAWYDQHRPTLSTQPVGGLAANELGIYDMSGNVWEWTSTPFSSGRVLRGGSWMSFVRSARVAAHPYDNWMARNNQYGFRVVFPAI